VSISEGREACQGKESEKLRAETANDLGAEKSHGSRHAQNVVQEPINLSGEKGSDLLSGPPKISSAANAPTAELVVTP